MANIKNFLKEKIIYLIFVLFILFILELTGRVFFREENELERIISILEQDPELFWRMRPNLNIDFQGVNLRTNSRGLRNREISPKKRKNVIRIACIGASPTLGWGVMEKDAYPNYLEGLLQAGRQNGKEFEVINAGIVGYSSYQGLIYFKKEILKYSPDLIIISYGVNDTDGHRFFRDNNQSDKEVLKGSRFIVSLENLFNQSSFLRLLKRFSLSAKGVNTRFFGRINSRYSRVLRVSPEDFYNNLNEIIAIARRGGVKTILIKSQVLFPLKYKECVDAPACRDPGFLSAGLDYAKAHDYNNAILAMRQLLKICPYSPEAYYYLGVFGLKNRGSDISKGYFQKAKEMELLECARLILKYNEVIEKSAAKNRIPLLDAPLLFDNYSKGAVEKLFINPEFDFVHPNELGHKIIAQGLFDILQENDYF